MLLRELFDVQESLFDRHSRENKETLMGAIRRNLNIDAPSFEDAIRKGIENLLGRKLSRMSSQFLEMLVYQARQHDVDISDLSQELKDKLPDSFDPTKD